MTGMARAGTMYPRPRYTAALAAAVTPIMKLLVVVETLNGRRMVRSIASTLSTPPPIPSSAESAPATIMRAKPAPGRSTW